MTRSMPVAEMPQPYVVGYYAETGTSLTRASRVHIVEAHKGPICGSKPKGELQFCAFLYPLQTHAYVTCATCQKKAANLKTAKAKKKGH